MLEKRSRVQVECSTAVENLSAHLLQWLAKRAVSRLGFYRPIKNEPDLTEPLLTWKLGSPQRCLCVPVVDDSRSKTMHYARWEAERVRIGCYGIEEPIEDILVDPEVILVPCVGVTREGFRLGNGGGYFDRWLAQRQKTPGLVTVAVAFDCLVTEDFVPEIFDIPLDWILTESGMRPAEKKTGRNTMDAARLMQH